MLFRRRIHLVISESEQALPIPFRDAQSSGIYDVCLLVPSYFIRNLVFPPLSPKCIYSPHFHVLSARLGNATALMENLLKREREMDSSIP